MKISCTRRWLSWWRWTMRRSSIQRCRTGIPATKKVVAGSTTLLPSAASAWAAIPRFPGRTRSTVVSKGISAGHGQNTYRGLVKILKGATGARNYTQCDSLLIGDKCGAHTFPYIEVRNSSARMEHEASTSKIGEDQIFYLQQRGISKEEAVSMIINGFCKAVFKELPMEFAVEAQKLLSISLEGSVG